MTEKTKDFWVEKKEIKPKQIIIYTFAILGVFSFVGSLPVFFGYSFQTVDSSTHSMENSLGTYGIGIIKNYKSSFTATKCFGEYLNGNKSSLSYNISIIKDEVKVGDIIVFYSKGRGIIHQVIEKYEYCVVTKGTNNRYNDGYLDYEDIKGRLVFWIKFL